MHKSYLAKMLNFTIVNNPTEEQFVGASWKDGTIVLNDDSEITGDVRGYTYGSDMIRSDTENERRKSTNL